MCPDNVCNEIREALNGRPGQPIVFGDGFPTPSGRGKLVPVGIVPPDELPDEAFPMMLTTGRQLEHWHTGAMTRRSVVLDALEPEAVASLSPGDMTRIGIAPPEEEEKAAAEDAEEGGGDGHATVPTEVMELVSQRTAAKEAKDWELADSLRARITELGFAIKDVKGGEPIVSRVE